MPEYRRALAPGATFFFTVATNFRRPILRARDAVAALRAAFAEVRAKHPFEVEAAVILPDHLHCIWTLPPNDSDFSTRWRLIKGRFTRLFRATYGTESGRSASRRRHAERGVWQRRFWEHVIRDEDDLGNHMDYIHYNPVKHGLSACPHAWPYSSFQRWVRRGIYAPDWCCTCHGRGVQVPDLTDLENRTGE